MTDKELEDDEPGSFPIGELKGKKITDIFGTSRLDPRNELYFGECALVLDGQLIIEMPYSYSEEVYFTDIPEEATRAFADLSDFPVYDLRMMEALKVTEPDFEKIMEAHFQEKKLLPEKFLPIVSYHERKVKYVQNRTITDVLLYPEGDPELAFLELDNGYLLGQILCTQPGTGFPGPIVFNSIEILEQRHGKDYKRLE